MEKEKKQINDRRPANRRRRIVVVGVFCTSLYYLIMFIECYYLIDHELILWFII